MCYSAMVRQHAKKLGFTFKARVDMDMFHDLFKRRAGGEKIAVAKGMEWGFLKEVDSAAEKSIKKLILQSWDSEEKRLNDLIEEQTIRLTNAEAALAKKTTKKAENDKRIAGNKIAAARSKLEYLREEPGESGDWIWPHYFFPMVVFDKELWIRPFRYHLRPQGQSPAFDGKYDGNYNARDNRLTEVFWWKNLIGRHQGLFVVRKFRERKNIERLQADRKLKLIGQTETRPEVLFDPGEDVVVPTLWDHWTDKENKLPDLFSAAAITTDPPKEPYELGIDRVLLPLSAKYGSDWLRADPEKVKSYLRMLAEHQWSHLEYEEVAA